MNEWVKEVVAYSILTYEGTIFKITFFVSWYSSLAVSSVKYGY